MCALFATSASAAFSIVVDFRPSMLFGTRRALRSVAAAEAVVASAWRTLDMQGRVGFAAATVDSGRAFWAGRAARARSRRCSTKLAAAHRAELNAIGGEEPPLTDALEAR